MKTKHNELPQCLERRSIIVSQKLFGGRGLRVRFRRPFSGRLRGRGPRRWPLGATRAFLITIMGLFSFLFGSCTKPQTADPPPPRQDAEAKADVEKLLEVWVPFAEQMLQQYRHFAPLGGRMAPDGTITNELAYNVLHPSEQASIDLFRRIYQQDARDNKLRACAIVYEGQTILPGRTEKQDAIVAAVDHVSGYSAIFLYTYTFDAAQKLQVDTPFGVMGDHAIFALPQQSTP